MEITTPIGTALEIAKSRRGILSARQLAELGLPARTTRRLVTTRVLAQLHLGVYRFGGDRPDFEDCVYGACVWGGECAMASHRCGARIHGLSIKSEVVEITVPHRTRAPANIKVHYCRIDPIDGCRVGIIPVTSVPLTLLMVASVVPSTLLEQLLDEALIKGKTTTRALVDILMREGRQGRPGVRTFRRLLEDRIQLPETIRTELERLMHRLLRDNDLPIAVSQYKVRVNGETYSIDFAYPELKIAIEPGGEYHLSRQQREADLHRQNQLQLNGWLVLPFTWTMVTQQPKLVAGHIRDAIVIRSLKR